jgi:hypothetical protein
LGVAETFDSKLAALAQLRDWRAMFERRDSLIYGAHLAGASYAEIREASGVAINTARSAIAAQEAAVQTATDPLAKFHHPHTLTGRRVSEGSYEFQFQPFTGKEPRPEFPSAAYEATYVNADGVEQRLGLWGEGMDMLRAEYDAALRLWAERRFRSQLPPMLAKASPVHTAYQAAREAMAKAYEQLLNTGDSDWRASIMRLTVLQDEARVAAAAWDKAEAELLMLEDGFHKEAGYHYEDWQKPELRNMLAEYGVDAKAWDLNQLDDHKADRYTPRDPVPPATKDTAAAIEEQNDRIRRVAELAGEPGQEAPR